MPVSARTAKKAIDRWELEHGELSLSSSCPCRYWARPVNGVMLSRQVYYCPNHRYRGRA